MHAESGRTVPPSRRLPSAFPLLADGLAQSDQQGVAQPIMRQIAGLLAVLFAAPAWSLGLGSLDVRSALNQPFVATLPLTLGPDEVADCLALRPNAADDLPGLRNARLAVLERDGRTVLEITTRTPVAEPVLKITLNVGCSPVLQRSYMVLLDPPVVRPPEPTPAPAAPAAAEVPVAPAAEARPPLAGAATAPQLPTAAPLAVPTLPRARPTTPARPDARTAAAARAATARPRPAPAPAAASPAPVAGDRVRIDPPKAQSATPNERLREERDRLLMQLDEANKSIVTTERELALQKRVIELTRQSEQVTASINAMTAALKEPPPAAERDWLTWALGVLAAIGLLGSAALLWRRRASFRSEPVDKPWWSERAKEQPGVPLTTPTGPVSEFGLGHTRPGTTVPRATMQVEETSSDEALQHFKPATQPAPSGTLDFVAAAPAAGAGTAAGTAAKESGGKAGAGAGGTASRDTVAAPDKGNVASSVPSPASAAVPAGALVDAPVGTTVGTPEPAAPRAAVALDFELPAATAPAPAPAAAPAGAAPSGATLSTTESAEGALHVDLEPLIFQPVQGPEAAPPLAPPPRPAVPAPANHDVPEISFETLDLPPIIDPSPGVAASPAPASVAAPLVAPVAPDADAELRQRLMQFAATCSQVDELMHSGEDGKALALLRRYVLRDETIPTLMWLQLFELYKRGAKPEVYGALAEHFARRYNRPMVAYAETLASRVPQTPLATNAALAQSVAAQRGSATGLALIQRLLCGREQNDATVFNAALQRDLIAELARWPG